MAKMYLIGLTSVNISPKSLLIIYSTAGKQLTADNCFTAQHFRENPKQSSVSAVECGKAKGSIFNR